MQHFPAAQQEKQKLHLFNDGLLQTFVCCMKVTNLFYFFSPDCFALA